MPPSGRWTHYVLLFSIHTTHTHTHTHTHTQTDVETIPVLAIATVKNLDTEPV